jgi:hypothetical protein
MNCPDCGVSTVAFDVPAEFVDCVPGSTSAVGLCPECLGLSPITAGTEIPDNPEFERISDNFPTETNGAVAMALLVGLLENLALYRSEISLLLERVERAGTDPLLVLDRLATDPGIETELDLQGRRRQLEQLL